MASDSEAAQAAPTSSSWPSVGQRLIPGPSSDPARPAGFRVDGKERQASSKPAREPEPESEIGPDLAFWLLSGRRSGCQRLEQPAGGRRFKLLPGVSGQQLRADAGQSRGSSTQKQYWIHHPRSPTVLCQWYCPSLLP